MVLNGEKVDCVKREKTSRSSSGGGRILLKCQGS